MRVVLYTRVSTEDQRRHGFSLPEQLHTLRQHARREGWEVVEEIADEGRSGADPLRPGIRRILQLAQEGKMDAAVAAARDRFFRSRLHRLATDEDLDEHGARLISLDDTGSKIADGVLDSVGEEERERTSKRTSAGKIGKARKGLLVGGSAVHFGFRYNDDHSGYEVDETKAALVRRIFRMVGHEGRSLTAVKTAFEHEGIPTPRGKTYWTIVTIKRILLNDVYLARPAEEVAALVEPEVAARLDPGASYGVFWYGKTRSKLTYGRKRKLKITEKDPAEHVAIPVPDCGVPPSWVLRARERVASNVRWAFPDNPFVRLRGRIRCGCGYSMTSLISNGRRYYVCSQHRKRGECPHRKFHRLEETEARVERFVLSLIEDPDVLREQVEAQIAEERGRLVGAGKAAGRLRGELDALQTERDGLIGLAARGLITDADLDRQLSGLDVRHTTLESELAEVGDPEVRLRELEALRAQVEEYLADLPHLVGQERIVREHETVPEERTPSNPLGIYTLTPERVRFLDEEELERRRNEERAERSARFRRLYDALNLRVVGHKDRSLEVSWGGGRCAVLRGRE
ncbi:MAG: recombinase family protein [Actinomycetota bacterium]|nr:recombinase family protein [Actinomycetota bacterium]